MHVWAPSDTLPLIENYNKFSYINFMLFSECTIASNSFRTSIVSSNADHFSYPHSKIDIKWNILFSMVCAVPSIKKVHWSFWMAFIGGLMGRMNAVNHFLGRRSDGSAKGIVNVPKALKSSVSWIWRNWFPFESIPVCSVKWFYWNGTGPVCNIRFTHQIFSLFMLSWSKYGL